MADKRNIEREKINDMAKFRDMQEQGTFHAGREYERDILTKRIKELEDYLIEFGEHKCGCLAITTNKKEHCTCGFEQAMKGK